MDIICPLLCNKVLARTAGFNEKDAQLISEYSQFVEDFYRFYVMKKCT